MKQVLFGLVLAVIPVSLAVHDGAGPGWSWRLNAAVAQSADVSAKEAFEATKALNTAEAWDAFLATYPTGFYGDLARAYVKNLRDGGAAPTAADTTPPPAPEKGPSAASGPAPATVAPDRGKVELGANSDLGGTLLMPPDSPWHRDISGEPVDPRSAKILARVGLATPLHPSFGDEWEGVPMGIPYVVVGADQPKVPLQFEYADESDPGPYPVPPDAPIEGGPNGKDDRHVIVLDRDSWVLYELFNATPLGKNGWKAGSGAIWDLTKNQVRPAGWTSADAAGLPILPGLVRTDEVIDKKVIEHALRFTLAKSRRAYVPPASHWASDASDEDLAPMGMRVRLKADFNLSGFSPEATVILQALKKYGMILADNGSNFFITGTNDKRWDADAVGQLKRVTAKDLEVIEMKGLVTAKR